MAVSYNKLWKLLIDRKIKKKDLAEAYRVFHKRHTIKPIDIFENRVPEVWEIDGEEVKYSW